MPARGDRGIRRRNPGQVLLSGNFLRGKAQSKRRPKVGFRCTDAATLDRWAQWGIRPDEGEPSLWVEAACGWKELLDRTYGSPLRERRPSGLGVGSIGITGGGLWFCRRIRFSGSATGWIETVGRPRTVARQLPFEPALPALA